ncbi:phage portal protein [Alkalihalophilus marmarensis]|uniref:Nucleoid-structuring protein H-NS n=1 Tax=Alkalihalophilus marmarensis DSM 21297 TaxID=1188261 RepID=U6SQV6_9BACI|nr:phage portal protein [Alkalihalophilus marmarensis]ERN54099.1 nucleoid-structuring protein H-NS [Alkalihalophilus marmarensis DSM 21297]
MLFRKQVEKRSETLSLQDEKLAKFLGIETDGISSNRMKEATYYACMRIMTDSVSKLPLKLYREIKDGKEKASGHYLYNLLKLRPNRYMSASTFWKVVEFQRNEHGHSVVAIDTNGQGRIKSLIPLNMNNVEIIYDNNSILGDESVWYVYRQGKHEYKFKDEQVLHFMGMTADGLSGISIKDYLRTIVENASYGQSYQNNFFKNGLSAKGLIVYTGDLDSAGEEKIRQRFESMSSGVKNTGRVAAMPLGFDYKSINTSMADAQFLEMNKFTMTQIANAFGVKSFQLNDMERSTHTNIEAQQKAFYVDTLQSIIEMYEQELTYKLLTTKEKANGYYFRFNVDSMLRSDIKTRFEAYAIAVEKGILTPNEVRELEERKALEGGDKLYANGNIIPITMAGEQYTKGGEVVEQERNSNTEQ